MFFNKVMVDFNSMIVPGLIINKAVLNFPILLYEQITGMGVLQHLFNSDLSSSPITISSLNLIS